MLQPSKTKFRKQHKGRIHGKSYSGSKLNFGSYGLKARTPAELVLDKLKLLEEQLQEKCKEKEESGLEYFPMFQLVKNQQKLEWAKVKEV